MTDSGFQDEGYPPTHHACDHTEDDGHDIGEDDEAAGMFTAEDFGDEVVRPRRHVRNIVPSADDGDDNDGNDNDGV